jgi:DnaK suppressor protein
MFHVTLAVEDGMNKSAREWRCSKVELERARSLLDAERARVQQLLADLSVARTDDHEGQRDAAYPAQPLAQQGVDDAVAIGLRNRLAALDRALQRVEDGSYGRSIRSGALIPDERLEADPAAEVTVQEAADDRAARQPPR